MEYNNTESMDEEVSTRETLIEKLNIFATLRPYYTLNTKDMTIVDKRSWYSTYTRSGSETRDGTRDFIKNIMCDAIDLVEKGSQDDELIKVIYCALIGIGHLDITYGSGFISEFVEECHLKLDNLICENDQSAMISTIDELSDNEVLEDESEDYSRSDEVAKPTQKEESVDLNPEAIVEIMNTFIEPSQVSQEHDLPQEEPGDDIELVIKEENVVTLTRGSLDEIDEDPVLDIAVESYDSDPEDEKKSLSNPTSISSQPKVLEGSGGGSKTDCPMELQEQTVEHVQPNYRISKESNTPVPNPTKEMNLTTATKMKKESTTSSTPVVVPVKAAQSCEDHYVYVKFGFSRGASRSTEHARTVRRKDELKERITNWLKQMLETDL